MWPSFQRFAFYAWRSTFEVLRDRRKLRRILDIMNQRSARTPGAGSASTSIRQTAPFLERLRNDACRLRRAREFADARLVADERDARLSRMLLQVADDRLGTYRPAQASRHVDDVRGVDLIEAASDNLRRL